MTSVCSKCGRLDEGLPNCRHCSPKMNSPLLTSFTQRRLEALNFFFTEINEIEQRHINSKFTTYTEAFLDGELKELLNRMKNLDMIRFIPEYRIIVMPDYNSIKFDFKPEQLIKAFMGLTIKE